MSPMNTSVEMDTPIDQTSILGPRCIVRCDPKAYPCPAPWHVRFRSKADIRRCKTRRRASAQSRIFIRSTGRFKYEHRAHGLLLAYHGDISGIKPGNARRSEERRVGKECGTRWAKDGRKKKPT